MCRAVRGAFIIFCVVAPTRFLSAQTAPPISGPLEAFTFDAPAAGFRAIIGRLGSSSMGPAVVRELSYGSVAPGQDYGIGFRDGRGQLVTGLASGQPQAAELQGSFSAPDRIAWSGDGSLAVFYSLRGNWVQTVSGLPSAPAASLALSAASLGGPLSTAATDLHGRHVVIGITGQTGGVYEMSGGNFVPLLATPQPQSLTFSTDGGTLYVLDGATHQLSILNLSDRTSRVAPLAGLKDPFAIQVALDATQRQVLYVAGRADQLLMAYDTSSLQPLASAALSAAPDGIEPLGANSFVLRSRVSAGDPLWSFTSAPQLAVYFVPAAPTSTEEVRSR